MGRLHTRMMERDVSIILSLWVMVRGMRRRMDRSIGIDSVREGIVDSEIFGVLGCQLSLETRPWARPLFSVSLSQ